MLKRLVKLVISLCFFAICWLWKWINLAVGKELSGTCVVLLYHNVDSNYRGRFKKQVNILRRLANPIAANNTKQLKKGNHYVAVTFDDGFRSIIENAVPALLRRRIPLTIFVPTGYLGKHPDWIQDQELQNSLGVVVDADQLKTLNDELITIGSHGVMHQRLSRLNEKSAKTQIYKSKQELEVIVNRPIKLFAFPHGDYNPTLAKHALQGGYERVFTVLPKLAFSKPGEYIIGRVDVSPADWYLEFILKLLGAYRWLPIAFSLKSMILNMFENILTFYSRDEFVRKESLQ